MYTIENTFRNTFNCINSLDAVQCNSPKCNLVETFGTATPSLVFNGIFADETLQNMFPRNVSRQKNSRQHEMWKIISDLLALCRFLQRMPLKHVYPSLPLHTCHCAALNKVCEGFYRIIFTDTRTDVSAL